MKRPLGISIIAVYAGLVGLLPFAVGVQFFLDSRVSAWSAILQLLPATIVFLFVFGLWKLRRWGLWLAVIYYIFIVLYTFPKILEVVTSTSFQFKPYVAMISWQILVSILILTYLFRPSIRSIFNQNAVRQLPEGQD